MTSKKTFALAAILGCSLAAASQSRLNRAYGVRCQYDGIRIQPIYRVDWSPRSGPEKYRFCCICCAAAWVRFRNPEQGRFMLRDEVDGMAIDVSSGYFVKSSTPTESLTGCRIHVFRDPLQAHAYLLRHQGRPVRPLF